MIYKLLFLNVFLNDGAAGKINAAIQSTKKKGCRQPFFSPAEKRF